MKSVLKSEIQTWKMQVCLFSNYSLLYNGYHYLYAHKRVNMFYSVCCDLFNNKEMMRHHYCKKNYFVLLLMCLK